MEQVRPSKLADPGKSDVLFELAVKEQQFQRALSASLEVSLQTMVAAERRRKRPVAVRARQLRRDAPPPPPGGGQGRGGPTFTVADTGPVVQRGGQHLQRECRAARQSTKWRYWPRTARTGTSARLRKGRSPAHEVAPGKEAQWRFSVTVPADAALTRPYFSRPDEEQPYYNISDERYRNLPLPPYPLAMRATLTYNGVPFEVDQTVQTNERISGIGNVSNPLLVGPAISVTVSPSAGAVPLGSKSFAFTATVHSNVKGPAQGILRLKLPQGWRSTPPQADFALARDGEDQTMVFSVAPDLVKAAEYNITAVAEYKGKTYDEGYHLAGYPGVRPYPLYRPATYRAVGVEVKTAPGLHIGFLPGTGDDVPKALENLNQNVRVLSESDLTHGDLSGYDAIILGVRAYAVRSGSESRQRPSDRLREERRRADRPVQPAGFRQQLRTLSVHLGANPQKVVDENSPVKFLDPSSPAFAWPNKVTEADFKGWVEERGHGFMRTWDSHYQPLVETHDPDQDPQEGGLLLARYGKGFYVYDAFALYRQLPSGVPGAYRLLGNLVSLE